MDTSSLCCGSSDSRKLYNVTLLAKKLSAELKMVKQQLLLESETNYRNIQQLLEAKKCAESERDVLKQQLLNGQVNCNRDHTLTCTDIFGPLSRDARISELQQKIGELSDAKRVQMDTFNAIRIKLIESERRYLDLQSFVRNNMPTSIATSIPRISATPSFNMLAEMKRQNEILTEQNTELRQKLQDSLASAASAERVYLLEQQIRVCTEDFEQERRDRAALAQRLSDVETALDRERSKTSYLERELAEYRQGPSSADKPSSNRRIVARDTVNGSSDMKFQDSTP